MAVDKTFLMRNIQKKEDMIVAFCMFTNMPFVVCDPETFNDQIWIFDTEEQLQEMARKCILATNGPAGKVKPLHQNDVENIYRAAL